MAVCRQLLYERGGLVQNGGEAGRIDGATGVPSVDAGGGGKGVAKKAKLSG